MYVRRKRQKENDPEERQKLCEEILVLSDKINYLKQEVVYCEKIEEQNKVIKTNLKEMQENEREKERETQEFLQKQKDEKEAKKYNNYKYKCPMCGSNKIANISTAKKVVSAEMLGLASDKIGKTYLLELCKIEDVDYVISDADFFDLVVKPQNAKTTFIKA